MYKTNKVYQKKSIKQQKVNIARVDGTFVNTILIEGIISTRRKQF